MGVTGKEAYDTIRAYLDKYDSNDRRAYGIVFKLMEYGIHPNAIKNAFREETKADVDRANEASE